MIRHKMSLTRVFSVLPGFWDRFKIKEQAPKPPSTQTPIVQHCIVEDWKKSNPKIMPLK